MLIKTRIFFFLVLTRFAVKNILRGTVVNA